MGTKQLFLEVPFCIFILWPHGGAAIMERICAKAHGCSKCPSVVPFKIFHFEGPFEVASFEHFGLERPFNVAVMIVFIPKCPSEGGTSHLERTISIHHRQGRGQQSCSWRAGVLQSLAPTLIKRT